MDSFYKIMPRIISMATALCKHIFVVAEYIAIQYIFFFFIGIQNFTAGEAGFWKAFILIVIYYSTSFAFALYNKQQCFLFLSKNSKDIFPEFLSFDFWCDIAFTLFFFLVFSVEFFSIAALIVALISNTVNYVFARYIWLKDKENKVSARTYNLRLIAHLLLSVIGIMLFFFFASALIPAFDTIVMVIRLLSYLIILPILYTVYIYIRALSKMKSFISQFKKFCNKNHIKPNLPKNPYLSIFKNRPDNVFILNVGGKKYSCSIISFANVFLPAIFRADGFFYRLSKYNIKNNIKPLVSFESRYTHKSTLPKIVILTSFPYTIMSQEGNKLKNFDTGDICGDSKIFTLQGFIGAVERNTLDRKSFE